MFGRQLKPLLSPVISGRATRQEVKEVVGIFHHIAHVYILRKAGAGRLNTDRFGISTRDLALDCIAGLFSRDEQGRFDVLVTYFYPHKFEELEESTVLALSRRLVFSSVNQSLYRLFGEQDSSFRKILRNLKGAVVHSSELMVLESQNQSWLIFCHPADGLPPGILMPPELLEAHLCAILWESQKIPDVLRRLVMFFKEQSVYRKAYPLLGVAVILRDAFERLEERERHVNDGDDGLTTEEIERFATQATADVLQDVGGNYVAQGKLDEATRTAYMRAVAEILKREYASPNYDAVSYYEILSKHLENLSKDEYISKHRSRLEYLVRLARSRFLEDITKEI